jgi:hypothetical protein
MFFADFTFCCAAGLGMNTSGKATTMKSKIDEYRAGAIRSEQRAKKIRNQDDREWQLCLARAYRILAEAEAERSALLGRGIPANRAAA